MASIKSYKLKNGQERWEYFVSNGRSNGTGRQQKIHKRGFRTHKEALKAAKIIEGQIASEEFVKENPQKMTISKFMNIWINEYKNNVKEGSRIVYRDAIRMYIDPYIGNYQLNKYKPADHQKFINSLFTNKELGKNKNGLSYNTVKIVNAALSNAFKKAQKLGYVKSNPTYLVEFPLDKVKEKTNKEKKLEFYTLEQENLFLDTARNFDEYMWYVFFLIIFDLGLRKGEVMALRWFNFDFRDNILTFDKQRLYRKERPGQVILDDVKTDAGKRSLKMTNRVRNSVLELYSINYDLTSNVLPMTNSNQDFYLSIIEEKTLACLFVNDPSTRLGTVSFKKQTYQKSEFMTVAILMLLVYDKQEFHSRTLKTCWVIRTLKQLRYMHTSLLKLKNEL